MSRFLPFWLEIGMKYCFIYLLQGQLYSLFKLNSGVIILGQIWTQIKHKIMMHKTCLLQNLEGFISKLNKNYQQAIFLKSDAAKT